MLTGTQRSPRTDTLFPYPPGGRSLRPLGAELEPGHEDDGGDLRQPAEPRPGQKVAGDGLDAPSLQRRLLRGIAEPGDADDALAGGGRLGEEIGREHV